MAEPAWKVAMRERKQLKEQEGKKKQAEREAYIASIPAWKRPLIQAKLEAEKTTETNTNTASSSTTTTTTTTMVQDKWNKAFGGQQKQPHPSSSTAAVEEPPKIPAWKMALKERQTVAEAKKKLEESKKVASAVNTSVSHVGRLQGKNLAGFKQQFENTSTTSIAAGEDKLTLEKKENDSETKKTPLPSSVATSSSSGDPTITNQFPSDQTEPIPSSQPSLQTVTPEPTQPSPPLSPQNKDTFVIPSQMSSQSKQAPSVDEMDPELLAMPPWKRELIMRKRMKGSSKQTSLQTPSAPQNKPVAFPSLKPIKSSTNVASSQPLQSQVPEKETLAVNKIEIIKSEDVDTDSPKLVKKEGKSLRAPVFKSTGKWADITEQDAEFQKLPPWKQEVIRRRKRDVVNRTAPPKEEVKEEKKPPPSSISTPWERLNTEAERDSRPEHGSTYQATNQKKPAPLLSDYSESADGASKVQALLGRFGAGKVIKTPAHNPPATPMENGEITLIDEESSDEEPTPVMKTTRSLSILKSPLKPKKIRKLSISWSDSNLSHFYPKYDYSDYDEIVQAIVIEETDRASANDSPSTSPEPTIATPIHPWLSSSNTKSPPPRTVNAGSFGSAGSFMSMYTLGSSPSSSVTSKKEEPKNEESLSTADIYSKLDSDTAALLF